MMNTTRLGTSCSQLLLYKRPAWYFCIKTCNKAYLIRKVLIEKWFSIYSHEQVPFTTTPFPFIEKMSTDAQNQK